MIYIFSEEMDFTTLSILRIIRSLNVDAIRINKINLDNLFIILKEDEKSLLSIDNNEINEYDTIYFRKNFHIIPTDQIMNINNNQVQNFIEHEVREFKINIISAAFKICKKVIGLTDYNYIEDQKYVNLGIAKECGLNVAPTIITNSKNELVKFFERYSEVITKPLKRMELFIDYEAKIHYTMYYTILNDTDFKDLPESIFPVIAQKYIKKNLEIRVFFWGDRLWSSAILSQNKPETIYDFRASSEELQIIPFKLPMEIENGIFKFIKKTKLKSGSIDLILDIFGKFYFLEVNSTGQFEFISDACNYHLAYTIANDLIK